MVEVHGLASLLFHSDDVMAAAGRIIQLHRMPCRLVLELRRLVALRGCEAVVCPAFLRWRRSTLVQTTAHAACLGPSLTLVLLHQHLSLLIHADLFPNHAVVTLSQELLHACRARWGCTPR